MALKTNKNRISFQKLIRVFGIHIVTAPIQKVYLMNKEQLGAAKLIKMSVTDYWRENFRSERHILILKCTEITGFVNMLN